MSNPANTAGRHRARSKGRHELGAISRVWRLARRARREFERRALPLPWLVRLYVHYNPAVEAERFCAAAVDLFPHGACGLTSLHVVALLGRGSVVHGRYIDEDHTFVLLEEDVIVDITADQFGGPRVYVGPIRDPWHLPGKGRPTPARGQRAEVPR